MNVIMLLSWYVSVQHAWEQEREIQSPHFILVNEDNLSNLNENTETISIPILREKEQQEQK
jgi:hypothetical protein